MSIIVDLFHSPLNLIVSGQSFLFPQPLGISGCLKINVMRVYVSYYALIGQSLIVYKIVCTISMMFFSSQQGIKHQWFRGVWIKLIQGCGTHIFVKMHCGSKPIQERISSTMQQGRCQPATQEPSHFWTIMSAYKVHSDCMQFTAQHNY